MGVTSIFFDFKKKRSSICTKKYRSIKNNVQYAQTIMEVNQMTESAVRSKLSRQGYRLIKTRDSYGAPAYKIVDGRNILVFGEPFSVSLDDVITWMNEGE